MADGPISPPNFLSCLVNIFLYEQQAGFASALQTHTFTLLSFPCSFRWELLPTPAAIILLVRYGCWPASRQLVKLSCHLSLFLFPSVSGPTLWDLFSPVCLYLLPAPAAVSGPSCRVIDVLFLGTSLVSDCTCDLFFSLTFKFVVWMGGVLWPWGLRRLRRSGGRGLFFLFPFSLCLPFFSFHCDGTSRTIPKQKCVSDS